MSTPGTVNYPASLDDAVSLLEATNGATTTLTADMAAGDVVANVVSTALFPATGALVLSNAEIVYYTGKTGTTFTGLIRGADGTAAIAHLNGDEAAGRIIARHHKVLAEALIAVETNALSQTLGDARYLRLTGGTLTGTLTARNIAVQSTALGAASYRLSIGAYGTVSETGGGLAYITGNSIAADVVDNQLIKTSSDTAHFIRMQYNNGISFHTNIVGALGTTVLPTINQDMRILAGVLRIGADGADSQGIGKNATDVLEINNGTPGTFRDLKLRGLTPTGNIVPDASYGTSVGSAARLLNNIYLGDTLYIPDSGKISLTSVNATFTALEAALAADGANRRFVLLYSGFQKWGSGGGAADVGITRNAAGVLEINNGTAGTFRDLTLRNSSATGVAYANFVTSDGSFEIWDTAAHAQARGPSGRRLLLDGSIGAAFYSSAQVTWSTSTSDVYGSPDVGLARNSAGVLEINNGTAGTFRDLRAQTFTGDFAVYGTGALYTSNLNLYLSSASVGMGSAAVARWSSTTGGNTSFDVGLGRNAANIVEVYDGVTPGTFRDLKLRNLFMAGGIGGYLDQDSTSNSGHVSYTSSTTNFGSTRIVGWVSGTPAATALDVALARNSAGVLEVNNGTAGTLRDLNVRSLYVGGTAILRDVSSSGSALNVLHYDLATFSHVNNAPSTQTGAVVFAPFTASYAPTLAAGSFVYFKIAPIYNETGGSTAANTDLLINRTETAIGSGTQRLLDLQVGGVTKFNVDNTGAVKTGIWNGTAIASGFLGAHTHAAADITSGILTSAVGGTANGFTKFSGPATSEKTFTLPNSSQTLIHDATTAAGDLAGTYPNPTIKASVSLTTPVIGVATGTSLAVTGKITSSSPTTGIGYATGAGNAVTQLTSKATGVTSNTITTAITLNNASLAAATIVSFTFTNSAIAATDTVIVTHQSAGTSGAYTFNAFPAAGSAVISIRNNTAGALVEAIVLRVTIIKSVSA